MPTIIHIATTLDVNLGGIARSVPALAGALAHEGQRVILIGRRSEQLTCSGESLPGVDLRLFGSLAEMKQMLEVAYGGCSGDVIVHHHGVWTAVNAYVSDWARHQGVPLVCSPRSMLDPWALQHRRWKKKLAWWLYVRRCLSQASFIHATAELERENIERLELGVPIVVVPNGVEIPPWVEKPAASAGALRRMLFLSRLNPKKGLPDLIGAFAAINDPAWELVIAGNDEDGYGRVCRDLACRAGLGERIRFMGSVKDADKWDLYRSADLFVLPSYSENFGLVVGESLACGTPVITTTAAPWQELKQHHCGWWIEPGQTPLETQLRESMACERTTLNKMGIRGRQLVESKYTWSAVAKLMIGVYRSVKL